MLKFDQIQVMLDSAKTLERVSNGRSLLRILKTR